MAINRVAITGSSGAYGRGVIRALRRRFPHVQVLGIDVVPPVDDSPDEFIQSDILNESLKERLLEFQPDTVIHFAFVVDPIWNETRMHQINVEGSRNILNAVREIRPERFLVSSSATAYGGWPDNPVPLDEDWPLRARPEYRYAEDKHIVEQLLAEFSAEQVDIAVSWTRPCIIYGPDINNYLIRFIVNGPLIALPSGNNTELQFVHIDDVSAATVTILEKQGRGPYNIAPNDWVTLRDIGRFSDRICLSVPFAFCTAFTTLWWLLRLPLFDFPSGLWYFIRYPWVVTPKRLTEELGFQFQFSSEQTLKQLLADANMLSKKVQSLASDTVERAGLEN